MKRKVPAHVDHAGPAVHPLVGRVAAPVRPVDPVDLVDLAGPAVRPLVGRVDRVVHVAALVHHVVLAGHVDHPALALAHPNAPRQRNAKLVFAQCVVDSP